MVGLWRGAAWRALTAILRAKKLSLPAAEASSCDRVYSLPEENCARARVGTQTERKRHLPARPSALPSGGETAPLLRARRTLLLLPAPAPPAALLSPQSPQSSLPPPPPPPPAAPARFCREPTRELVAVLAAERPPDAGWAGESDEGGGGV